MLRDIPANCSCRIIAPIVGAYTAHSIVNLGIL